MRHDDVFRKIVNFFGNIYFSGNIEEFVAWIVSEGGGIFGKNIEEFVAWIVSERDIFGKNIGKNTAEKKDFVTLRN